MEIFKASHANQRVSFVKPRYYPQRPIQGIVQLDGVDISAIKAEAQFELPEIFWSPISADTRFNTDKSAITEALQERMQATGGRAVDTSMWCK